MARHIERAGVDLSLSRVLAFEDTPVGLSLSSARGDIGYLAGFGIASIARRRGWARTLLREQSNAWREAGLFQVQLEVIEQNPARQLYAQEGFTEHRMLQAFEGKISPDGMAGEKPPQLAVLDAADVEEAHARLHTRQRPTWRRQFHSLATALRISGVKALGLMADGEVAAYAITQQTGPRMAMLDAAAANEDAARHLLYALSASDPGQVWRLVDEPEGTPVWKAASILMDRVLRQAEMVRALG
jgi:hypothetical protein